MPTSTVNQGRNRQIAEILLDNIKTRMSGNMDMTPKDLGDKWVYAEIEVNTSADLLSTSNDFLGTGVALTTSDTYEWVAIKNTSTTATDGICICLAGETASHTLANGIFIGAGEMICLKIPFVTVANLHAASVTMNTAYGFPSSSNSSAVTVQVAAIIDDASYTP